jgi:hypothetical protein
MMEEGKLSSGLSYVFVIVVPIMFDILFLIYQIGFIKLINYALTVWLLRKESLVFSAMKHIVVALFHACLNCFLII